MIPVLLAAVSLVAAACSSKDPDRPTAADATWSIWPGTIEMGGDLGEQSISFVIRLQQNNEAGSFLYVPPGGAEQKHDMKSVDFNGSTLEYSWVTAEGKKLECRLEKRSSTLLSGDCLDPSGSKAAAMSIKPPPGRLD